MYDDFHLSCSYTKMPSNFFQMRTDYSRGRAKNINKKINKQKVYRVSDLYDMGMILVPLFNVRLAVYRTNIP